LPELESTDWLVILLYALGSIGIGVSMRSTVKAGSDYFQAGRQMRTWVCAVAFMIASLGAPEVLGLGAAGAAFGFRATLFIALGSIPALLLVALFVLPLYYRSGADSLPGYLGLRFDGKTRKLSAVLFILMSLASAGIALFVVARILQALRIFDRIFFAYGWPREGEFLVCILLAAIPVFVYVVIAGLRGTIISQVVQFVLLVAGFLPVVLRGLSNIGGMSGVAGIGASFTQNVAITGRSGTAFAALAFGFVLGASRWFTDFRILQVPLAARCSESARRLTVLAAGAWIALPFVSALVGAIAISIPTPQSKTVSRNENGAIYHEITIVPREISEGRGIVPAVIDPATNNPRVDSSGHTQLDYGMATPNMLMRFGTTGLLGLAIAGLLASLMSSVASAAIAMCTVFVNDLYGPKPHEPGNAALELRVARGTSAISIVLFVAAAFGIAHFNGSSHGTVISTWLAAALTVFAVLQGPQLATFVIGAFTKRAGGTAAFAGLVAGFLVAVLHLGLTLPGGGAAGLQGGWLGVVHRYDGVATQAFFTVVFSLVANLGVTLVASAISPAASASAALVYRSLPDKPRGKMPRGSAENRQARPEVLALGVILITLVLALIFA